VVYLLGTSRIVRGYPNDYVVIAERALGHELPPKAVIHHVDEDRTNSKNDNLVICESQGYHMLLHRRLRAFRACGNANYVSCPICHQYDDPMNMAHVVVNNHDRYRHRACHAAKMMEYKMRERIA
jgi:hypothetical protein